MPMEGSLQLEAGCHGHFPPKASTPEISPFPSQMQIPGGWRWTGLSPAPGTVSQAVEHLKTLQSIPQAVAHALFKSLQDREEPPLHIHPSSFPSLSSPELQTSPSLSAHILPTTVFSDSSILLLVKAPTLSGHMTLARVISHLRGKVTCDKLPPSTPILPPFYFLCTSN